MSDQSRVTVEDLLKKIGALVVQNDVLQSQVNALLDELKKLSDEREKKSDDKK